MKDYGSDEYYDTPNQRIIDDSTYMFIETLNSVEGNDIYIDEIPCKAYITNSTNPNNENKEERTINVLVEQPIKTGSYIKGYDEGVYLVIAGVDNHISHKESKIRKCNYVLKWMDENGLHEQPCIVTNNTKYTGGTKSSTSGFTEIDAMVNISISSNKDTNKINYGKRLYVMKNAWRVTLIDNVTTENVFSWTLGKDSINSENDNVILGICDYYEHSYVITLDSTSQSLVETGTYEIKSTVKDEGKIVLNPNITYSSSDETIATVNEKGLVSALKTGNCTITVSIGGVNTTLNLTVTAKTSTPVISYTCDWSTGKTSTGASLKTYMSSVVTLDETINGVSNPSLVVNYSLDSIGTALLNAKSISITRQSDVSFLVKNINVNTSKSFSMTFTDNSDNSVINTSTVNLTKGI